MTNQTSRRFTPANFWTSINCHGFSLPKWVTIPNMVILGKMFRASITDKQNRINSKHSEGKSVLAVSTSVNWPVLLGHSRAMWPSWPHLKHPPVNTHKHQIWKSRTSISIKLACYPSSCMAQSTGQLPRDAHKIDAFDQWCLKTIRIQATNFKTNKNSEQLSHLQKLNRIQMLQFFSLTEEIMTCTKSCT